MIVGILSLSCGGGGDEPAPPPVQKIPPSAATLIFPYQNSECLEGTNVTNTQSTINFEWSNAANTNSYELVVKNLKTTVSTTHTSTTNSKSVVLERGVPYSWYVISKSTTVAETATSSTWKFYNAGLATQSYPPFPAEILAPLMGAFVTATSNTVTLKWKGSDVENDIASYEVYFGVANPPAIHKPNHTTMELAVTTTANTVYYWKVVTKDTKGNTSDSGIYQFKTN